MNPQIYNDILKFFEWTFVFIAWVILIQDPEWEQDSDVAYAGGVLIKSFTFSSIWLLITIIKNLPCCNSSITINLNFAVDIISKVEAFTSVSLYTVIHFIMCFLNFSFILAAGIIFVTHVSEPLFPHPLKPETERSNVDNKTIYIICAVFSFVTSLIWMADLMWLTLQIMQGKKRGETILEVPAGISISNAVESKKELVDKGVQTEIFVQSDSGNNDVDQETKHMALQNGIENNALEMN